MRAAAIQAIEVYLPERVLTNADLVATHPTWSVEKIADKTGIYERRLAAKDECTSDMAVAAAEMLFASGACQPSEIEFILLCTQSPDYFLPTTACLVQDRLGIPTSCGALDFNLGCSGFVYGLGLAKSLVEAMSLSNVLLITADTYSKFLNPEDHTVRTLFGDAAAATLLRAVDTDDSQRPPIGPFEFGTDGSGAHNLIVRNGGMRCPSPVSHNETTAPCLHMNGAEIFTFALREVPKALRALLSKAQVTIDDVDVFVFHQANTFMLEHLRNKLEIPEERFFVGMQNCGNTVSASIPIALKQLHDTNKLKLGDVVVLVGFGVGLSWSAAIVRWV